jgi:hypothetical protein
MLDESLHLGIEILDVGGRHNVRLCVGCENRN